MRADTQARTSTNIRFQHHIEESLPVPLGGVVVWESGAKRRRGRRSRRREREKEREVEVLLCSRFLLTRTKCLKLFLTWGRFTHDVVREIGGKAWNETKRVTHGATVVTYERALSFVLSYNVFIFLLAPRSMSSVSFPRSMHKAKR